MNKRQYSLIIGHRLLLSAWSDFMIHACLCCPHTLCMLPIACHNPINSNLPSPPPGIIHLTLIHNMPQPPKNSKMIAHFIKDVIEIIKVSFHNLMHHSHRQSIRETNDNWIEFGVRDGISGSDLQWMNRVQILDFFSNYIQIFQVISDMINHLTQSSSKHSLSVNTAHDIFCNLSFCIRIISNFSCKISEITENTSPQQNKRRKLNSIHSKTNIDCILELLITAALMLLNWMMFHCCPPSKTPKKPLNRRLNFSTIDEYSDEDQEVVNDMENEWTLDCDQKQNISPINTEISIIANISPIRSTNKNELEYKKDNNLLNNNKTIEACLIILDVICKSSKHLMIQPNVKLTDDDSIVDQNSYCNSMLCIFPYLLKCIPVSDEYMQIITDSKLISFCLSHFDNISNDLLHKYVCKRNEMKKIDQEINEANNNPLFLKTHKNMWKQRNRMYGKNKEYLIKHCIKQFEHKKVELEKEFLLFFIPNVQKMSEIVQIFVSIADHSFDSFFHLIQSDFLKFFTNCLIFKSNEQQFIDPYFSSNEENPIHEFWIQTLELFIFLVRKISVYLSTKMQSDDEKLSEEQIDFLQITIEDIMYFFQAYHRRILRKIDSMAEPKS